MARYDTHWKSTGKKRRETRVRWGKLLIGPGVVVAIALFGWALLRSPLFDVEEIEVRTSGRVDKQAVIDAAEATPTGFFRRMATRANLLGWPGSLSPDAVRLVPGAKSIAVDRGFFTGALILTVEEREPAGVWCFEASGSPSCQWFDESGVVYGRAYVSQGSLVAVVHDHGQEQAGEGRRVLPQGSLEHFLAIFQVIKSRGISPKEVVIGAADKEEVTMTTYNGPRLLFTLRAAPDQVAPVLDDFLKKGALSSVQYIDFRSPKRAFYE